MPSDLAYYPTTTIDASPAALPREGEGLVDCDEHARVVADLRTMDGWLADAQREIDRLRAELAKRDDLIAHCKIGEAGWQEEAKGLEAKVRNLQANLDGAHRELAGLRTQLATWENAGRDLGAVIATRDREIASLRENLEGRYSYEGSLQADVHVMVHAADDLALQLSEAKATITALRSQLTRAEAIEEATRALRDHLRPRSGQRWAADAEAALSRVDAALVSPSPRDTAEGERPSIMEGIAALRAAGGSDWDKVTDVRAFLGRDEDEKLEKLARLAVEAAKLNRGTDRAKFFHAMTALEIAAVAALGQTPEATPCPSR